MIEHTAWLGVLLSSDAPALPAAWGMQLYRTLGWAAVLALLVVLLASRLSLTVRRALAAAIAIWTVWPGPTSPDYWLGLAFHAPSLTATGLCAWLLQRRLFPVRMGDSALGVGSAASPLWLLLAAVALGYALLLDTFAVLPLQVYAWGFSPALLLGLLALSLLPWVLRGSIGNGNVAATWVVPLALLLFAGTRLPTGNVWDALLDPWLWLLLQVLLIQRLVRHRRG